MMRQREQPRADVKMRFLCGGKIYFELDGLVFERHGEHSAGGEKAGGLANGESICALNEGDDFGVAREFGVADEKNVTTAKLLVVANPSDREAATVRKQVA